LKHYSPLRYPGGKNKLAKFVGKICVENNNGHYVEPYAGGASVALYLMMEGLVEEVTINDLDKSIYAFWYSVLNDTEKLCAKIYRTDVTVENWEKQKRIQKNKNSEEDLLKLGFSTFFLNRTNRSGILDGGIIGGKGQTGNYKIDCRYNKTELVCRIREIAKYKDKINIYNLDALDLIDLIQSKESSANVIFYFDPPYYLKGPSLYMSHYTHDSHQKVGDKIRGITNAKWIVSYDNTPQIKEIYKGLKKREFEFLHTAQYAKIGKEILFYSDNLIVPRVKSPTKC
jgi:DNA adenine methylase